MLAGIFLLFLVPGKVNFKQRFMVGLTQILLR